MLGAGAFQRGDLALQRFNLLAGTQQHAALHVKLLARYQIEITQSALQHAADVRDEVLTRLG